MNPNIEKALLELPKFKKGKRALHEGECYCAQGALCEIFRQQTGCGRWRLTLNDRFSFVLGSYSSRIFLPQEVCSHFGLTDAEADEIMRLNDNTDMNIPEIINEVLNES